MEKDTLERQITRLQNELDKVYGELELEKTWAEGEIDFWQEQCHAAELDAEHQKQMKEYYLEQLTKKPWWRYVFS